MIYFYDGLLRMSGAAFFLIKFFNKGMLKINLTKYQPFNVTLSQISVIYNIIIRDKIPFRKYFCPI